MTRRDEVIRMAQESKPAGPIGDGSVLEWFERFAALAAKAERERCALIAITARDGYAERSNLMACAADYIACAIRALKDESK